MEQYNEMIGYEMGSSLVEVYTLVKTSPVDEELQVGTFIFLICAILSAVLIVASNNLVLS
jgi:hypothetical protein